jgi:hypothetical protein
MKPISKDHPDETRLLAYLDSPQSEELKDNSNSGDTILNYDILVTPGHLIKYGVPGILRNSYNIISTTHFSPCLL